MLAVEAHRGHHQRTVAVQLTVDVTATVLAVPFTLLIKDIVQVRIGAQRGLLAQIALDVATARIGERGKDKHSHVAELRVASTVIQNGLRGRGVEHGDLGQDRSGLLGGRRGLGFGGLLDGLGRHLGIDRSLDLSSLSSLDLGSLDVLGSLLLSSRCLLDPGLHRRDKTGRHTIELAHAGKRTLDVLGTGLGHSRHMALGGLGTCLTLGIGLTRSVGPAVTVPAVDVCHTWPPFLSLPLSAFPIHDTPPHT